MKVCGNESAPGVLDLVCFLPIRRFDIVRHTSALVSAETLHFLEIVPATFINNIIVIKRVNSL